MSFYNIITLFIVIVGGSFIITLIYENYKPKIKSFIKKHIVDFHDNHHDPRCFDCNRGSCIEPVVCHVILENCEEKEVK